jgi:hypothetical protein
MRQVEEKHKRVKNSVGTGERFGQYTEAAQLYAMEVVEHIEGVLGRPVDAYAPPPPPWS